MGYITRRYRKVFGRKSPYRRTYGSRNAGQAIGTSWRMMKREAPAAAKLAFEIAKIKKSLNVEKKHKDVNLATYNVGQVYDNVEGAHVIDVTPTIAQGTDGHERTGNSCKLTGFAIKYQLIGMGGCHSNRRIRMMLVKSRDVGSGGSGNDVLTALYDPNPLTTVRDTNAPRNYSSMKHHGLTVVRTKTVYLKSTETGTAADTDHAHSTGSFTCALSDVLRFEGAGDSTPEHVKYYLILQADVGNAGGVTSTLPVPVINGNSAVRMRSTLRTWWVDN